MTDRFIYQPAEDDSVDPEWVLASHPTISVQDCRSYGGGFTVVETSGEGEPGFWIRHHGSFRSLKAAKDAALQLAQKAVA